MSAERPILFPIRSTPYDIDKSEDYPDLPELMHSNKKSHVWMGKCRVGDVSTPFASKYFSVCSAVVVKAPEDAVFAFFHALPGQDVRPYALRVLRPLRGGSAIVVRGSNSEPQIALLRTLSEKLEIRHNITLSVDTLEADLTGNGIFDVVFRAGESKILVARHAQQDVVAYDAF